MLKVSATDVRNTQHHREGYSKDYYGLHKIFFNQPDKIRVANAEISKFYGKVDEKFTNETLLSQDNKIFWWVNIGLYNLFFECFSHLLNVLKSKPNSTVIINDMSILPDRDEAYYKFMLKSLEDIGVKWEVYDNKEVIYANNFTVIDGFCVTPENVALVKDHFKKYVTDKDVKPFRKVYLSRKHMEPRNYKWIKDGLSCSMDHRLFDEEILESFMAENGFEVIIPEHKFKDDFLGQLNYMNEVETLVSLSSSGIANALFMQKNTSVVEFITTYPMGLITGNWAEDEKSTEGVEAIHHLYQTLSYTNHNCYFGVPNWSRYSKDLIDIIKSNNNLRKIIME